MQFGKDWIKVHSSVWFGFLDIHPVSFFNNTFSGTSEPIKVWLDLRPSQNVSWMGSHCLVPWVVWTFFHGQLSPSWRQECLLLFTIHLEGPPLFFHSLPTSGGPDILLVYYTGVQLQTCSHLLPPLTSFWPQGPNSSVTPGEGLEASSPVLFPLRFGSNPNLGP